MVDPVSNNIPTFLRAQIAGSSGINAGPAIAQKISTSTQSSAVVPAKFNAVPQTSKGDSFFVPTSKTPLPRGSIVDRLV